MAMPMTAGLSHGCRSALITGAVRIAISSAVVVVTASQAPAEDCTNPQTQLALNECAAAALSASEVELGALYEEIRLRLKSYPEEVSLFETAQRDWMAFRDAECDFTAKPVESGSIYPLIFLNCQNELTRDRERQLRSYLSCEEGDLSCPVPSGN